MRTAMQRVSPQYIYTYTYRYTYRYAITYAYTYTYTAAELPSLQPRSALAAAKWESRLLKGLASSVMDFILRSSRAHAILACRVKE